MQSNCNTNKKGLGKCQISACSWNFFEGFWRGTAPQNFTFWCDVTLNLSALTDHSHSNIKNYKMSSHQNALRWARTVQTTSFKSAYFFFCDLSRLKSFPLSMTPCSVHFTTTCFGWFLSVYEEHGQPTSCSYLLFFIVNNLDVGAFRDVRSCFSYGIPKNANVFYVWGTFFQNLKVGLEKIYIYM